MTTKCPSDKSAISFALGRTRSVVDATRACAAGAMVGRRMESAMTSQCYTTPRWTPRSERVTIRELGHVALFVARPRRDPLLSTATPSRARGDRDGKGGRIVFFSAGVHHHVLRCELARAEGRGRTQGVPGALPHRVRRRRRPRRPRGGAHWARRTASSRSGDTPTSFSVRDPDGHRGRAIRRLGRPISERGLIRDPRRRRTRHIDGRPPPASARRAERREIASPTRRRLSAEPPSERLPGLTAA